MSHARVRRELAVAAFGCLVFCCTLQSSARAEPPAGAGDFIYHAQIRDTLIGVGRRLLRDPARWHEVQTRNSIANPNRMARGATLRIPYAWLRTSPEMATVASVTGAVKRADGAIAPGERLPQGSVIETGADGSVTIKLADGSVVTLQKSSVLQLDEMARVTGVDAAYSIRLKLESGRVETAVKPHRDVGRFEIITPVAVTAVRGTRFRDGFDGNGGRSTTETLEGTVGVAGGSDSVPVPAGFGTRVERGLPPLQPVPLLPPPDLAGLPRTNSRADLHLEWRPVGGAAGYRVQLAADPEFHTIGADVETALAQASIAHPADGDYWLRARSIDRFGIEGTDAVARFTQHVLPAPPLPAAPQDAARLSGSTTRFEWLAAGSGATYTLQLTRDRDFSELLLDRPGLAGTHTEIDGMAPGTYFWRVGGVDSRGQAGPWSDVRSFTLRPDAPLPEPPRIDGRQIQLEWAPLPVERYHVEVASDRNFNHAVYDRFVDSPKATLPKPFPGTYYVRIQGIDADGSAAPYGPARRFQVPVPGWIKVLLPALVVLSLIR